jgi:CHAT domain-containing protein/tetratricopeptide (TPR) repeat protein
LALQNSLRFHHADSIENADIYYSLGMVNEAKGNYTQALKHYLKDMKMCIDYYGEYHPKVAYTFNATGIVFFRQGKYEMAEDAFQTSLDILKRYFKDKNLDIAYAYNSLGLIFLNKSQYDLAIDYFNQALAKLPDNSLNYNTMLPDLYNNLGNANIYQGNLEKALEYHQRALDARVQKYGKIHPQVAMSYHNIANIYLADGDYEASLSFLQKALDINKLIYPENHMTIANAYKMIASVYAALENQDQAVDYYNRAIIMAEKIFGKKHPFLADAYNRVAYLFYYNYEDEKALKYVQRAINANFKNRNDENPYNQYGLYGYSDIKYLNESLVLKAKILSNFNGEKYAVNNLETAVYCYQLSDTLIDRMRQSASSKNDKLQLAANASDINIQAIDICMRLANVTDKSKLSNVLNQVFYFSEKNKANILLEALTGAEAQKFSGIPDSLIIYENNLKEDIANLELELLQNPSDEVANEISQKLFGKKRKNEDLIVYLEENYPKYHELKYASKPALAKELQESLDKDKAIISYTICDSVLVSMLISKNRYKLFKTYLSENYREEIGIYRNSLTRLSKKSVQNYLDVAFKWYELLFPSDLRQLLETDEINQIYIIPDEELSQIPFETLLIKKTENQWTGMQDSVFFTKLPYLISKYAISYAYSGTLLLKTEGKKLNQGQVEISSLNDWLALAPVFDDENSSGTSLQTRELLRNMENSAPDSSRVRGSLLNGNYVSALPGTEEEVTSIYRLFDKKSQAAKVLTHHLANESFVKSDEISKFRFIHFATHGFVNSENPELSGILMAQITDGKEDGILYSGEIYNLKLNADLVVLSACETGLGKISSGEGVIGLTRALLYAGSKNLIVSLWQVNDASTSELMIEFYTGLLESKTAKSLQKNSTFGENLRQAKLKLIKNNQFAHPYFWSPFILLGK